MSRPGKFILIVSTAVLLCGPVIVRAGVASQVIDQAVEFLTEHFATEVAEKFGEHGSELLAKELTETAAKYGEHETVSAVERAGPQLLGVLAEAGNEGGPRIITMVNRVGDDSVYIVARPRSVAIFLKYGDPAVDAMLKHKEIAEELIECFGGPSVAALIAVDGWSARRLAIMAEDGNLPDGARAKSLLDTVARYGDPAVAWIWENRESLAVAGVLPKFLAEPQQFFCPDNPTRVGSEPPTVAASVPYSLRWNDPWIRYTPYTATAAAIIFAGFLWRRGLIFANRRRGPNPNLEGRLP